MPYQVFGVRWGALSVTIAWKRLPSARSFGDIFASAALTALSPSWASFSSFARALIAAFSSAENPVFFAAGLIVLLSSAWTVQCGKPNHDTHAGAISGAPRKADTRFTSTLVLRRNREPGIRIRAAPSGSRPALAAPPLQGGAGRAGRRRLGGRHPGLQPERPAGAGIRRLPAGRPGHRRARPVRGHPRHAGHRPAR